MDATVRTLSLRPVILGGMVLLGMFEFLALQRSQWLARHGRLDGDAPAALPG